MGLPRSRRRALTRGAMRLERRTFLEGCLGLVAIGGGSGCQSALVENGSPVSFGELIRDPEEILHLPTGFRYVVLEKSGDEMSDGHAMGARPDGMACFEGDEGTLILMRNHELDGGASPEPDVAYDPNMLGGVSRVALDKKTLTRKSSNWVLTGTHRNCAGGPSPWGWLSCEESDTPRHGYVFLCDPNASRAKEPQRAPSLGRFKHEAIAVDPDTEMMYLTEDENRSALYRHVPVDGPFVGRLEALKVAGKPRKNLSEGFSVGDSVEIEWVQVADPEGTDESLFEQAWAGGAALIVRGEGIWFFDGSVFFVSTEGGPLGRGQVFRLDPSGDRGTLTLIAQAEGDDSFVNPDNITVSPSGEVFVVEDNDGPNRIWRLREGAEPELFAENALNGGVSEFCGVCFSPDGATMFVNIQEEGLTLAISGPFAGA
jgi:uncharacterized protein